MTTKHPIQSKTIIGILVATLSALVGIWLVDTPTGIAVATATTMKITTTIGLVGGAVTGIYGRLKASKSLTL